MKFTGSLRHLFGRADKKRIPPPPEQAHNRADNRRVHSPRSSAGSGVWGAPRPRNEKPGAVSRAGLGHTPEGYLFIHGSRFNVQKSEVAQKSQVAPRTVVFVIPRRHHTGHATPRPAQIVRSRPRRARAGRAAVGVGALPGCSRMSQRTCNSNRIGGRASLR